MKKNSDNLAVVNILNNLTSKSDSIMVFVRLIVFLLMKYNIRIKVIHIEGFRNITADKLSRNLLQEARKINPLLNLNPVVVPQQLLPQNWSF